MSCVSREQCIYSMYGKYMARDVKLHYYLQYSIEVKTGATFTEATLNGPVAFYLFIFAFFLITMQVINTKKKMKKKKYANSGTVSVALVTHTARCLYTRPPSNNYSILITVNLWFLDKGCNARVVLFNVRSKILKRDASR